MGIRTDLPSCKVRVAPSGSTPGSIIYPCDNLLVLSDLSTASSGGQSFVETTKPSSRLVAYSISNDGTLLSLAENNKSSDNASVSLVTLYSLASTNKSASGPVTTAKKKKVIQIESGILYVSFVDSTHVLILGDGPDYTLTLWSTGTSSSLSGSPGTRHPRHPGGCLASIKLATPSGKTIYRAEVSPIKDDAGNSLVCVTGGGVLRLFRLSTTNNTFRPVTVNLKRKQQNYISQLWLSLGQIALGTDTGEVLIIENNVTRAVLELPEPHTVANSLAETSRGDLIVGSDGSTLYLYGTFQDTKETLFRHKASTSVAHGAGRINASIVGNESSVSKIKLHLQEKTAQEEVLDLANEVRDKLQLSPCGRLMVGTAGDTDGNESILMTSLTDMEQTDVAPSIRQISSMQLFGQNLFVVSSSGSMHHFAIVDIPIDQSPNEQAEVESACHAILSDQVLVSESDLMDRRVLIQSLEQQLAELQQQNADDIQRLDNKCQDALEVIQEQSQLDDGERQRKCQEAAEQRSKMEQDSKEAASSLEKSQVAKMKGIEQTMEQKIAFEIERTKSMKSECASKTREWNDDIKSMEHQTAIEIQQVSFDFSTRTENEVKLQAQLSKQQEDLLEKHHRLMESLEAIGDEEITGIMLERERELLDEQKATRQLREEQAILKAKLDSLLSDLDEQKDAIESLHEKEAELVATIDGARHYIRQRQSDMHSQDDVLSAGKDKEIDLKRKCTELNQRRACLEEEIAQRNELLSQIEADIVDNEKTAAQIRADLSTSKRAHSNVNLAIANLKDKVLGLDRERQRQRSRLDETAACTLELEKDIFDLVSSKEKGHGEIKAKLLPLCTKYLETAGDPSSRISSMQLGTSTKRGREARESESQRREQILRKKIETIKKAMAKAEKKHAQDMARLRWQQKVLKQNISEIGSSDNVPSDSSLVGKENSANNGTSSG